MLLKTFEYLKPNGLNDVLQVLEELKHNNAHILAGGTDLIPWLRAKVKQADCLVDLVSAGLDQVIFEKDEARIGAMVSFATLCRHPQVVQRLPALAEAASQVGAVQTRTLATLGGNLCSAVPSLDGAPPLLALAARFRLQAKGGERVVPAEKFFLGSRRTVLQAGEILTEILVPLRKGFKVSFLRMGRRKALTLSIVNVAAGVAIDEDGGIECARISLGAVAPTPIRAVRAEQCAAGTDDHCGIVGGSGSSGGDGNIADQRFTGFVRLPPQTQRGVGAAGFGKCVGADKSEQSSIRTGGQVSEKEHPPESERHHL